MLSRHCKGDIGEYVYMVNCDEQNAVEIVFDGMNEFSEYDVVNDTTRTIGNTICLSPCEAILLKKGVAEKEYKKYSTEQCITENFKIKDRTENALMLDFIHYSKNGVDYSDEVFYSKMLDELHMTQSTDYMDITSFKRLIYIGIRNCSQ